MEMELYEIYEQFTGRLLGKVQAVSESSALFHFPWGYGGVVFMANAEGRPAMVTPTETYRARKAI